MEISDIKIFNEVARLKSTLKAAESLGYVQSNISKRILKLEEELGKKLFLRTNRGMNLTSDGEKFLIYAKEMLFVISKMERDFLIRKEKINIGGTGVISKSYLSKYYLREDVALFSRGVDELVGLLKNGELDFIVINKEVNDKEFKKVLTLTEKIYWIQAKKNKKDFNENKIVISRNANCPYRIETLKYIKENKFDLNAVIEVDTIDILIDMIENSGAIAILPEKIITLNNKLKKIRNINLNTKNIYVYKLNSNTKKFDIELN